MSPQTQVQSTQFLSWEELLRMSLAGRDIVFFTEGETNEWIRGPLMLLTRHGDHAIAHMAWSRIKQGDSGQWRDHTTSCWDCSFVARENQVGEKKIQLMEDGSIVLSSSCDYDRIYITPSGDNI